MVDRVVAVTYLAVVAGLAGKGCATRRKGLSIWLSLVRYQLGGGGCRDRVWRQADPFHDRLVARV
jgi:hypothetical protein